MSVEALFNFDTSVRKKCRFLIGTDEAGRGPGAGPVCAAAVCFFPSDDNIIERLSLLNDSKKLASKVREELYEIIINNSVYSVNFGTVEEIEKYNILKTSLNTMRKSCLKVASELQFNKNDDIKVLVDGNKKIPDFPFNQEPIVKGDAKSASIAAASILAKVTRDRLMIELDKEFPQYYWAENKGYMTKSHLDAVDKYGLTIHHRKKFFEKHFDKARQLKLGENFLGQNM